MAKIPEQPTTDQQIRTLQDQVRRLWTRIPLSANLVEQFADIEDDDLYNESGPFEGWAINDPLKFSKQGNFVHVWGSVQWTGAGLGYSHSRTLILRAGVLPDGFLPNGSRRILTTSGGTSDPEKLWELYLLENGIIQTDSSHLAGSAPWGTLADPATPIVNIEFSYALVI